MKLKYNNFEFIQNPQKITVKKSKSVGLKPLPGLGTEAQEICDDAAVIKIYGRFYGKDGDRAVKKLYALQAQKQAGACREEITSTPISHLLRQQEMLPKTIYPMRRNSPNRKSERIHLSFANQLLRKMMKTPLKLRQGAA